MPQLAVLHISPRSRSMIFLLILLARASHGASYTVTHRNGSKFGKARLAGPFACQHTICAIVRLPTAQRGADIASPVGQPFSGVVFLVGRWPTRTSRVRTLGLGGWTMTPSCPR